MLMTRIEYCHGKMPTLLPGQNDILHLLSYGQDCYH